MHFPPLPIIASVVMLAAAPVLAQSTSTSGSSRNDTSTSSSQVPPDTAVTVDTQQKLKQSLEQNGFKNVLVVPEAYVIHAQAPDGWNARWRGPELAAAATVAGAAGVSLPCCASNAYSAM